MKELLKNKLKRISIQSDKSMLNAIKQMDDSEVKLLIVFRGKKFYSLLSIGDIQRSIIRNDPFDTKIDKIVRKNIVVAHQGEDYNKIKEYLLINRAECMPILDSDNNLVDIVFWEDVFEKTQRIKRNLKIPVVIMAGGKGTRLKPITNVIPKALIPIGEQTIIEHIIDNFYNAGCRDFFISVNYKSEMIKNYLMNKKTQCNIDYIEEKTPLGTAGSLFLLKNKISQTFFVSNCDILIKQDIIDIYNYHKENNNDITLVSSLKFFSLPYGTIESGNNGSLLRIIEKPELTFMINSGIYLIESDSLNIIPNNKYFDITQLIDKVKKNGGKVGVFPISEKAWFDIGGWNEYQNTLQNYETWITK